MPYRDRIDLPLIASMRSHVTPDIETPLQLVR
jgi:hypothetical protein